MSRQAAPDTRDHGFTLVEMIMAVAIMGIITATLGGAVYLAIRATSNNYTRLGQSNTEMVITRYLTGDIQGATSASPTSGSNTTVGCTGTTLLTTTAYATATETSPSLTVRWVTDGTNGLLRCIYSGGSLQSSMSVASGITQFTSSCTSPCATVRVTFTAAGAGSVPARQFQVDISRRTT